MPKRCKSCEEVKGFDHFIKGEDKKWSIDCKECKNGEDEPQPAQPRQPKDDLTEDQRRAALMGLNPNPDFLANTPAQEGADRERRKKQYRISMERLKGTLS